MTETSRTPRPRAWLLCAALILACGGTEADDVAADSEDDSGASNCGPSEAVVERVIDGDTVELDSGDRVRYLMIDTPESTTEQECWGEEAKAANVALVEGKTVQLRYDVECTDNFGRLLAYVEVSGQEINRVLVERGHACVLHIPPNGDVVVDEYEALELSAQTAMPAKGLWGACDPAPCG